MQGTSPSMSIARRSWSVYDFSGGAEHLAGPRLLGGLRRSGGLVQIGLLRQIMDAALTVLQQLLLQLMRPRPQPDQRGIRAGSATCAPAHDELGAFPDALAAGRGTERTDGSCPAGCYV